MKKALTVQTRVDKTALPFRAMAHRLRLPFAMGLLVVALPLQGQGLDVGVLVTASLLAAMVFLMSEILSAGSWSMEPGDWWLVAFLATASVSAAMGFAASTRTTSTGTALDEQFRNSQFRYLIHYGRLVFLALVYFALKHKFTSSPRLIGNTIRLLSVAALLAALYGVYQVVGSVFGLPYIFVNTVREGQTLMASDRFFSGVRLSLPQMQSTFTEPKDFSWFLNMTIFLIVGARAGQTVIGKARRRPHGRWGWFDASLVTLLTCCLAFSLARSAFVVTACQIALCLWLLPARGRVRISIGAVVFVGACILVFWIVGGNPLSTGTQYIESFGEKGGTADYYAELNDAIWQVIPDAVWLGHGPGGLGFATASVAKSARLQKDVLDATYLHVSLLGSTGVVGLVCFGMFLAWHVRKLFSVLVRLRRSKRFPSLTLFLGFVTVSVVGTWLRMALQAVWMVLFPWFVLALACGIRKYAENQLSSACSVPRVYRVPETASR